MSHDRRRLEVLDSPPSDPSWGWWAKLQTTVCQKVIKITPTICVKVVWSTLSRPVVSGEGGRGSYWTSCMLERRINE